MDQDYLDIAKLEWLSHELAEQYQVASPFPHIFIDEFLDKPLYDGLQAAFPGPDERIWYKFQSAAENQKLQSNDFYGIPRELRTLITELNGPAFVKFLEKITGIQGLVPDPHLYGGGLHQTLPGGHLGVHIDYNYHVDWKLDRRLNVILYFNEDWEDGWGGHLELWDKDVKNCVQKIAPVANRLAIFNTDEFSWHGHPDPLSCPQGRTRKSIALYYYSNGRPESEQAGSHNTVFMQRPGEKYKMTASDLVRGLTPPLVKDLAKRVLKRGD